MVCPPDPGSVLTETPGRFSVPEGRTENRAPTRGHSGGTPLGSECTPTNLDDGTEVRADLNASHDTNSPLPPLGDPGLGTFMLSRQPKMPRPTESRSSRFRARRQSRRLANPAIWEHWIAVRMKAAGRHQGGGSPESDEYEKALERQGRVRDLRASMSHGPRAMPSTRSWINPGRTAQEQSGNFTGRTAQARSGS
jgi:hypothetical protein